MNNIIIIDDRQLLSKTLDRIVREEVTREDILEEGTLEVTSTKQTPKGASKRRASTANTATPSSVKKLKIESARKRAKEVLSQLKGKN